MFSITNGRDAIHFEIARHFPKGDIQPFDEYFLRVWGQSGFISFDKQVDATRHDLQGFYNSLKKHYDSLKGTCKVPSLSYDEDFQLPFHLTARELYPSPPNYGAWMASATTAR